MNFLTEENPFTIFNNWLSEAKNNKDIIDYNAVSLATSTKDACPSVRIVLLKQFDEKGFVFFTNLNSRKAREIKDNPKAAMCFYWDKLGKQIRIEGNLEMTSKQESDKYFLSRDINSRIGAWSSKQSEQMEHPDDLKNRFNQYKEKFADGMVPRPEFWGGIRLIPEKIEFWHAKEFRLHDRRLFSKDVSGNWIANILYP